MDQRLVELTITARRPGRVEVKGPPNANVAPLGHHMLFLLNDRGVPSVARLLQLA